MTFNEAKELFKTARNKVKGKLIGNNKRLIKLSEDCYGILLHNTVVVQIWDGGMYKLNTGGWYTVTTKKTINQYSPVTVRSIKKQWYVLDGEFNFKFENGMRVYA